MSTAHDLARMNVEPLRDIELDTSLDQDDFDVFEAFEQGSGNRGEKVDPYPEFHRRRREQPVYFVPPEERGFEYGGSDDGRDLVYVYRYEDVLRVLQESDTFSSERHAEGIGRVFGHSILEMGGEEHALHRRLIQHAFKRRDLARWKASLIPRAVNETLDSFIERGHADLAREFTLRYPVKVIEAMMGLPQEHVDWYHRRAIEVISIAHELERALRASVILKDYFEQVIEIRRSQPGDGDLITLLIEADAGGRRLRNDEIIPFLMLLAPAGAETTYRATGTLLYALLDRTEQLEAVRADRSLIPRAVEEAVRWDPPLTGLSRRATRDVEFQGIPVKAGTNVNACLASANRDPEVFEPADTVDDFDLFRPRRSHTSFAGGAHVCLGQILARTEMETALNLVLDRLPDLQLDPAQREQTFMTGQIWRSPNQLPAVWNPGA